MSPADDNEAEMYRRSGIDDHAIEAFIAGSPIGDGWEPLDAFASQVRRVADGPVPEPSLQLAAFLSSGLSTEKSNLPATAASNVTGPAPQVAGLPKWRKKSMALAEFLAGLSVAAKAALGIGVAAASVTAAGAAGALPGPAQDAVAATVRAVTPFSFPESASDSADFGKTVSTDARDGGVDGQEVSDAAKENGNRPSDPGKPSDPGQNGLDRAGETPAADHLPESVPVGSQGTAGSEASTGLDRAGDTPAADNLPESVPVGPSASTPPADAGSQSSTGLTTADSTPAADHLPSSVPARP